MPSTLSLRAIFRPGFNYAKAGAMLLDLQDGRVEQAELDAPREDRSALMAAMDRINMRYGRGTLQLAVALPCASSTGRRTT